MTTFLTALLPDAVEIEETTGDLAGGSPFPEESIAVARAVPTRQAEYFTVRDCARRALARLGHPPAPILSGAQREPLWPDAVVGSLTHCDGYRGAAVARSRDVVTLGIDAEPHGPLPPGVETLVASNAERAHLARLRAGIPAIAWDRVLFSAKESVFKAWFPLTRAWLDFAECDVTIDPNGGTFSAALLVPGPVVGSRRIEGFSGRWVTDGALILTAVVELPGK